jgi:hypothetical protein
LRRAHAEADVAKLMSWPLGPKGSGQPAKGRPVDAGSRLRCGTLPLLWHVGRVRNHHCVGIAPVAPFSPGLLMQAEFLPVVPNREKQRAANVKIAVR